ncbi:MAG: LamG-like jellyroll fold domain-containing protein [Verrucomicrobiota bacterium]
MKLRFRILSVLILILAALVWKGLVPSRTSQPPAQRVRTGEASKKAPIAAERGQLAKVVPAFDETTQVGNEVAFELPGGKQMVAVVERYEADADGNWQVIEGKVTEPAEGRIYFRRQPEGTPSGRFAGAIRFPKENYGYLLGENSRGEPELTRKDADGVTCVELPLPPVADTSGPQELLPMEHPTDVPIPGYQNGVIPLQSLPKAVGVIYLDFDGEEGPHDGWGDFDAAPSGANNTQILEVWARISEDFAPFNINVTTDLQIYLNAPETSRQRCIITPTNNAAPGAGGVAYIGSWNWGGDTPCWAFYSVGKAAAEVISHEIGHTLGLGHDGQNPNVDDYYGGHGNGATGWAPIMGVGYYQNLTQWSRGEYINADQSQDDLAVIDGFNAIDFRADDSGNTAGTASPLELFGTTVNDDGVISTRTDVDVFSFKTTGGNLSLAIEPAVGPNLDLSVEIRNSSNAVVALSNPDLGINATLSNLNLAAGTYTLHIDGVGRGVVLGDGYSDYASIGHYAIDGTIGGAISPDRFAIDEFPPNGTVVGTVTPDNNHGANPLTYTILSGNIAGAFSIGASTGTLAVANPSQFDYDLLSNGWNDPAEFELSVQVTDATNPALNETLRVIVKVNDTEAIAPVTLKHRYSFASDATDSVGNADLTLVGTTAVTGGALNLPGGATRTNHATAQGAALTELGATINTATAITMEAWFNQDTFQGWAKIFMAGLANGNDFMDITPRRNGDGFVSSMTIRNDGDAGTVALGGVNGAPLVNNTEYYVAATWDATQNLMTLRIGAVGGTLSTYTGSMGGRSLASISVAQFFLGSAVFFGDPDFDGQIDEFRIWSGALGAAKVAANFAAGPNSASDTDLDGLPDTWELTYVATLADLNGNLSAGGGPGSGTGDYDGDGLSDFDEYHGGIGSTNPNDTDSDNDTFSDLLERTEGTDPNNAASTPAARLEHRYPFKGDTSDAIGTANLTLQGTATVVGGQLELPGGATRTNHAMAQGAALTEIAGTINDSYALTIEGWFNQDTAQNWAKLLMAGKSADFNYIELTPRRALNGNVSSIGIRTGGAESVVVGAPGGVPLVNNTNYYVCGTWNPLADQLVLRMGPVGGALSTFTASMGGLKLSDLVVNEFRVGAAVQFNDPDFDGQVDEIRLWRGILTAAQAQANFVAGPVQPTGDLDGDALPDEWEMSFALVNQLSDLYPLGDFDGDGLNDGDEFTEGTDPTDTDSDNDTYSDGIEVALGSDPTDAGSVPVIPATVLAHRYSFATNTTDGVGHADLTLVGTAAIAGGQLELPGGAPRTNHATAQGTALTALAATIQNGVGVTMEGWFNQDTAQNWSKLFMAGRGTGGEYMDITPRRGTTGNAFSISFNNGTTESAATGGAALTNETNYYVCAIWNPVTDQLTLRTGPVGGALSTYTASLNGRTLSAIEISQFHLGAAVQFPDQDFDGQIDEFRVWKGALSASQVNASFAAGPNSPPGDSDGDGLNDAWEFAYANHLETLAANGDADGDGLTNAEEEDDSGTSPIDADSDNDTYSDRLEYLAGSDPNNAGSVPTLPSATLAHRYSFANGATDSVGNAHLTLTGTAAVTGGKLNLPGGVARTNNARAEGASLTALAGTINGATALTMEGWFRQDTFQNWAKIFMAGQGTGFNFMDITPRRLVDGNASSISINNGIVESNVRSTTALTNGTDYYFAATWNSVTDQLTLRIGPVGGAVQTHVAPMGGKFLADINIAQFFLGSAVQYGDPDFDGQIDEFRIWKGALTANDVASHFALGPDLVTAAPTIKTVSINAAKDTLTLGLEGLAPTRAYYLEESQTLQGFALVPGSAFTAAATTATINIPINPFTQPKRFFRLAESPPAP